MKLSKILKLSAVAAVLLLIPRRSSRKSEAVIADGKVSNGKDSGSELACNSATDS